MSVLQDAITKPENKRSEEPDAKAEGNLTIKRRTDRGKAEFQQSTLPWRKELCIDLVRQPVQA